MLSVKTQDPWIFLLVIILLLSLAFENYTFSKLFFSSLSLWLKNRYCVLRADMYLHYFVACKCSSHAAYILKKLRQSTTVARVQKYENRRFSVENSTETLAAQATVLHIQLYYGLRLSLYRLANVQNLSVNELEESRSQYQWWNKDFN